MSSGSGCNQVADMEAQLRTKLTYDSQGNVDWDVVGNCLTSRIIEEASQVKLEDGKLQLEEGSEWKYSFKENNVFVLEKKQRDSPLKGFMGCGVIGLPVNEIAKVLDDFGTVFLWDKFTMDAKYIRVISESETHKDFIAYRCFVATRCFFKVTRDACYYARSKFLDDGRYVLTSMSVADPKCPPVPGLTRMKIFSGTGWLLEPYEGSRDQTMVTYMGHSDLVGFPPIVINLGMKRFPMNIYLLRRFLEHSTSNSRQRLSSEGTTLGVNQEQGPCSSEDDETSLKDGAYEDPIPLCSFTATDASLL